MTAVILATTSGAVGLSGTADAAAATPGAWAYAVADQKTADSYIPLRGYQANSAGTTASIVRSDVGTYLVTFPGVQNGGLGRGTVSISGVLNGYCKPTHWGASPSNTALQVGVRCFGPEGTPDDEFFHVLYANAGSRAPAHYGYVLANQPTAAGTYTPARDYQFNAAGAVNTVTRMSTGSYVVTMPKIGRTGGTVKVSEFGSDNAKCSVVSWSAKPAEKIDVACTTPAGAPVDAAFTVTWADRISLLGRPGGPWAYVFANRSTTTTRYTPDLRYQGNSTGAKNTVTRNSAGSYAVRFPGLASQHGSFHATAATPGIVCNAAPAGARAGAELVDVSCVDVLGSPVDASFTAQYTR